MTGVPEWITDTFAAGRDETPKEGEDAQAQVASEAAPHITGETSEARTGYASTVGAQGPKEAAGPGKPDMRLKGEYSPQLPSDIQDERQLLRQKEVNYQVAQAFTRLNEGRAIATTKAMAQEIYAEDAEEMDRLNREHFSRWEKENAQFRADIDAARQLRVNPNNYMQSIGRSGRVASVLSVAVSQLAAGAGNPSMVYNRLKSTIDQDIAAQKANIELEYAGIEAAQGQQDREVEMLNQYYAFEEKSRAVALYALEAQLGVIQQRAQNEMEYQAYQMIRDRARAEAIDSASAALAKNATLYLDGPVYQSYQALLKAKKWQEAQAMLQAAYAQQLGGAQDVDTAVQSYDAEGTPIAFDTPEAAPLGEVVEGPEPTLPGEQPAVAPRTAAPARKRTRPTAGTPEAPVAGEAPTSPEEQPAEERPLTPEEAEAQDITKITYPAPLLTPEEQADYARREEEVRKEGERRARIQETTQQVKTRMGPDRFAAGGHLFYQAKQEGWEHTITDRYTFQEAAGVISQATGEIAVGPSYKDARELVHYDPRTGARAAYEKAHPELYEGYNDTEHEGTKTKPRWVESNWLDTKWGKVKLKGRSLLRANPEKRAELEETINKDYLRARDLMNQAKSVRSHGLVSFMGVAIGPDGPTTFANPEMALAWQEQHSGQIGLGIQAMKQLDPSGRLTDKDIEVGRAFMNALANNTPAKAWEVANTVFHSLFGDGPKDATVRKSIEKCMGAMAGKLSLALRDQHHHNIVMDFDQAQFARDEQAEVYKWLGSSDADIKRNEETHRKQLMEK